MVGMFRRVLQRPRAGETKERNMANNTSDNNPKCAELPLFQRRMRMQLVTETPFPYLTDTKEVMLMHETRKDGNSKS